MSTTKSENAKQEGVRKARPTAQIYRPPGLRSGNNLTAVESFKQTGAANKTVIRKESDQLSNASSGSQSSSTKKDDRSKPKEPSGRVQSKYVVNKEEIISLVQKLNLSSEQSMIDDFIEGMNSPEVASRLGHFISRYAIEESKQSQRTCSQLCSILIDCPAGPAFYKGLVESLQKYFECADKLRSTHFRVWQNFLNFLSDAYLNVGYRFEGEFANLIFKVFNYMLSAPILQELKIEELECLISILLSLGYELERDCPFELSILKNLVRDALILANESWSRKMLLLLMELSASNYTLSAEANDYYFQ